MAVSVNGAVAASELAAIDSYLATHGYLGGFDFSFADIAMATTLKSVSADLTAPHLKRWYGMCCELLTGLSAGGAPCTAAAGAAKASAPPAAPGTASCSSTCGVSTS